MTTHKSTENTPPFKPSKALPAKPKKPTPWKKGDKIKAPNIVPGLRG